MSLGSQRFDDKKIDPWTNLDFELKGERKRPISKATDKGLSMKRGRAEARRIEQITVVFAF